MDEFFWAYWPYHIPNYLLAVIMYTLLGRLVLGFFVPEDWDNYIWRAFRQMTDPVLGAVRFITPSLVEGSWLILLGAVWIMVTRVAFTLAMAAHGLTPTLTPAAG